MIGRTFLKDPAEYGIRLRAKIIKKLEEDENTRTKDSRFIKFRCLVNDGEFEEIVTYIDMINHIESDNEKDHGRKFSSITDHQGPLSRGDEDCKGSRDNVLVNWDSGESTYEPLDLIGKDDPVTCALYAKKNNLLDTPGWKRFKRIATNGKQYTQLTNQVKTHTKTNMKQYQFGVLIPHNHQHVMDIDMKSGNKNWYFAEQKELKQTNEYNTFIDKGKNATLPEEYTKIKVHFVYAVKHDGRYKARLVAGGHLTKETEHSTYSEVVSLKGIRIVTFSGELNKIPIYSTDKGNAYLEAKTKEKVYNIA